ncbi:MAG TPA: N-acetyl-gamma-glutamyl-phosphate reductase [Deltaproteobacteria bacterium]|nr:N-acetyl-gamma-glutamyl-phosphate reductase [Deltaproteobacteria bacterium]
MRTVGVVGATGYTGVVLLSILEQHPSVKIALATSNTHRGKRISSLFPLFRGRLDIELKPTDGDHRGACDAFFLCLPHGSSAKKTRELYDDRSIIIDLSADFRFEDRSLYERHYITHGAPELIPHAVFGSPELYRGHIRQAKLVANPGCYPTSAILALAPLVREGLVAGDVFIDSKSGVSGAGREAKMGSLFCEVSEGFRPYNVGVHRHEPEIQKELSKLGPVRIAFTPHLLPINRGILTTIYGRLTRPLDTLGLLDTLKQAYEGEPFVRIMDEGVYPDTRYVRFSNYCDIGGKILDGDRFVIISAIDNLVKGASGQAVQNMNIALGLEETAGLTALPQFP